MAREIRLGGESLQYPDGTVGAAVLHEDQLEIPVTLCPDALQTHGEHLLGIIDGHDDAKLHRSLQVRKFSAENHGPAR